MTPWYDDGRVVLHVGHVLAVLAGLEAGSVQTCITSPPYWGLRAYGTDPQVWGGDPSCSHTLEAIAPGKVLTGGTGTARAKQVSNAGSQYGNAPVAADGYEVGFRTGLGYVHDREKPADLSGATCTRCGAWRGELGSEPTPEQYVANIVAVFRAVRRVLRDDGTLWVNLGDSYSGSHGNGYQQTLAGDGLNRSIGMAGNIDLARRNGRSDGIGLKPKDLVGIPWMVAFALRADGWYLRSDIIWAKSNPMPESVTDRPTKSHEYLFLLSKQPVYYFDSEAVREKAEYGRREVTGPPRNGRQAPSSAMWRGVGDSHEDVERGARTVYGSDPSAGRNIRSVWTIPTESFPGGHFATFPRKLMEPCVLAGTSARGQCPACGAPWARIVEREGQLAGRERNRGGRTDGYTLPAQWENGQNPTTTTTTGWAPTCRCDAGEPVPQVVLDIFAGSGTTLAVARWHQRRAVGIELNPEYARLIEQRLAQGVLL